MTPLQPLSQENISKLAYSGHLQRREIPKEDAQITHSGPSTPLGEYLRKFWQPVCMSEQLKDVPHKIRIMSEDLIAFRDRSGRVGVLARHCCHRGASLEFGIVQERGIRCCYHGFHYDVDGTIIDVPIEPDNGARLRQTVVQGAYPAIERDGLVFAYMGPPNERPPFPESDAFEKYDDTDLVPFANSYPCNWLQVLENIADQLHTSVLHQPAMLYDGKVPADLDVTFYTLPAFGTPPVLDFVAVRSGTAMAFIAGRRMGEQRVWWRINECVLPNMTHHAYLFEDGSERRIFHRVHMSRWYVPVDDTNSIIYGWRMFGGAIDPFAMGRKERVGWEDMDFLEAQVGNRTYDQQQRLPGDFEAVVSQRPIAIHALEHPTAGDRGVYMYRKLLRDAVLGTNKDADPEKQAKRLHAGLPLYTYTQNTVLNIPQRAEDEDRQVIRDIGRKLVAITSEADALVGAERNRFVHSRFEELERAYT
ncbi:Rieske 2Fe-2S domain-containing protein [Acidiphilium sp. AL]|uniref:Rieske 2Fe-2S domain-containing protein n=1 Tax=Acidiphilium sp. AL TaxID=2871704 RepID=UPI0021CB60C9|nr:Rieske 2Fe-2S domain-containing protein [Acidiphilium sp. AL]MCU4161985.1 Rieske 2Fe-2S domain-containing protein [Acidiphilium sp. AL]